MAREEKIKLAYEKGITYDPTTGKIYGVRGNEITRKNNGYIDINMVHNKKTIHLSGHQFAWYFIHSEIVNCIDHINGVKDDNRIINLRSVTQQLNNFNRKSVKGYQYNGYSFSARIIKDGNTICLGSFETEQEAQKAYIDAKKIYHKI